MRRIRVTGRFYVFLLMLAIGLFFIAREFFAFGTSEAIVTTGSTNYTNSMNAVIVRDELVASYEGNGRVIYIAEEGAEVDSGDIIAEVYSAGYASKAFTELEEIRRNIRTYYQEILDDIIDTQLDRLEANVQAQALELKRMIQNKRVGNLDNVGKLLEQTMSERQSYLNANKREDKGLNRYYEQEANKLNTISSWKSERKANKSGVVSFYLDGYEEQLSPSRLSEITSQDIKNVLQQRPLASATVNARQKQSIFKVVSTDKWYVLLLSSDSQWNPVNEQTLQMQMDGVNNYAFSGTVVSIQKSEGEVLALVEVETPIGPMLNRRSGRVNIGVNLTGFTVPLKAIGTKNGQSGVWLSDAADGTFVPVEVLSTDSRYALIVPIVEGTLVKGQRVMLR